MDFTFTPDEQRFRDEVRAFLAGRLPDAWDLRDFTGEVSREERLEVTQGMSRALAERHWLALPWPEAHGGLGAQQITQAIFNEEAAYARMPGGNGAGVTTAGPAIMQHGSPEQQQRWLSRIARGDDRWCVLYAEDEAGSDFAGIQTRAERHGDEYVVNGAKQFVAGAQDATMGWLAARTGGVAPSRQGISMFALPMDAPGVTVRPVEDIAGGDDLCEVRLDEVHLPADHLVGEDGAGWQQLAPWPQIERSGVEAYATGKRNLEWLVDAAREDAALIERSPGSRYELADRWIELQVGFNVAYRVPSLQQRGQVPDYEASLSQLYGAELTQRIAGTGMRLFGASGQLTAGSPHTRLNGAFTRLYLQSTAATVARGTAEVQRNVIAERGLGLPRASSEL